MDAVEAAPERWKAADTKKRGEILRAIAGQEQKKAAPASAGAAKESTQTSSYRLSILLTTLTLAALATLLTALARLICLVLLSALLAAASLLATLVLLVRAFVRHAFLVPFGEYQRQDNGVGGYRVPKNQCENIVHFALRHGFHI